MSSASDPRLPPRWFIHVAWAVHRAMYSITGGRLGLRKPTPTQWGMLRLRTVGWRSGTPRVAILGYFEDGQDLVTMAMNGWGAAEPAWWLNLQARPETTVELVDGSRAVHGRAATRDERERLWARWAEYDKGLDAYAARRPSETAVVILEPRAIGASRGGPGVKAITRRRYWPPDVLALEGAPGHRPDLSVGRGGGGDALSRDRPRAGQGRHHGLKARSRCRLGPGSRGMARPEGFEPPTY